MQAVVVGAGKLGFEVARRLAEAGHEVVLVDQEAAGPWRRRRSTWTS